MDLDRPDEGMPPPAAPGPKRNAMSLRDPRNRGGAAQAVQTKTNPHTFKVWRKGNTGDKGKRGVEVRLWEKLTSYLQDMAMEADMKAYKDPTPENEAKCANVLYYDYFENHGIVVPASAEARLVVERMIMGAEIDGQRFTVDRIDMGPLTIICRIQFKPSDKPYTLEDRFKSALKKNNIPQHIRQQMEYFGMDRYHASVGQKRKLIQFKVTREAAEYIVGPQMRGKMFFERDSVRIEYNGTKLTSLEGIPFGYHISPPNQKEAPQKQQRKAGNQDKGPSSSNP